LRGIDGKRAGAGGIDADADDLIGGRKAGLFSRLASAADAFFQPVQVIGRILAGQMMVSLVEQHALVAARIID
jgi:hypothetical protein